MKRARLQLDRAPVVQSVMNAREPRFVTELSEYPGQRFCFLQENKMPDHIMKTESQKG